MAAAKQDIQLAFVGLGGDGMQTAARLITFAAAAQGIHSINIKLFGPEVKGGTSVSITRVRATPVANLKQHCDAIVVFSWATYEVFREQLDVTDATVFLVESSEEALVRSHYPDTTILSLPIKETCKEVCGTARNANLFATVLVSHLLKLFPDALEKSFNYAFRNKITALRNSALKTLEVTEKWLQQNPFSCEAKEAVFQTSAPLAVMNGNEACVLGALAAGCNFFTGYPITPATYYMELCSSLILQQGGRFIQTEDEISAVTTAIGAAYAGARCVTTTSGPGLSLMQEGLSLAYMAELPLVVLNVQRGGPSTGLPTMTEQSDLMACLYGAHGDAPRIVLAPESVSDCFRVMKKAFRIAETYQMPVIVLSDANLATRLETLNPDDLQFHDIDQDHRLLYEGTPDAFLRYRLTENGVSPMSFPGKNGIPHLVSGLEHDETGRPAVNDEWHRKMSDKRKRKLLSIHQEYHTMVSYGNPQADVAVLSYGSCNAAVREAVDQLNQGGNNLVHITHDLFCYKLTAERDTHFMGYRKLIIVELSATAQFYQFISSYYQLPEDTSLCYRPGGSPYTVSELVDKLTGELEDV